MMPADQRSQADYAAARFKASLRALFAFFTRRPNKLLTFEAVREKLRIGGPVHKGVQPVALKQIVGTVDRYNDFDRAFLPTQEHTSDRWRRISRAWYEDVSLPPILLYQVGAAYFVVDGHHRVSVAREQGQEFIDAEVRECSVKVPVSSALRPEDLEELGAQVIFLERTNLDQLRPGADIQVTILGGYDRLLEHIAVHRFFMGHDFQRDITEAEGVTHWYDTVYLPVLQVLRDHNLFETFPHRTPADFYLWVMDHRHFLVAAGQAALTSPEQTATEFVERLRDLEPPTKGPPPTPNPQPPEFGDSPLGV